MKIYLDNEQEKLFLEMIDMIDETIEKEIRKLDNYINISVYSVQQKQLEQKKNKYEAMHHLCNQLKKQDL